MSRYTYIIDKLREATWPDRTIDCYVWVITQTADARMHYYTSQEDSFVWERGIDGMWIRGVKDKATVPAYTASIDACVALVERMLPGWDWGFGYDAGAFSARLSESFHSKILECFGPTLPLAIMQVLFKALEAKEIAA